MSGCISHGFHPCPEIHHVGCALLTPKIVWYADVYKLSWKSEV